MVVNPKFLFLRIKKVNQPKYGPNPGRYRHPSQTPHWVAKTLCGCPNLYVFTINRANPLSPRAVHSTLAGKNVMRALKVLCFYTKNYPLVPQTLSWLAKTSSVVPKSYVFTIRSAPRESGASACPTLAHTKSTTVVKTVCFPNRIAFLHSSGLIESRQKAGVLYLGWFGGHASLPGCSKFLYNLSVFT
jgi:hypothetical protein